jgi:hypothetical protein
MADALQAHLGVLADEVRAASIPSDSKHTVLWCLESLPTLYAKFCQTSESRYGHEITRLVQAVFKELLQRKPISPEVQQLAVNIANGLRLLHEQLGLPELNVQSPRVSAPRLRRVK